MTAAAGSQEDWETVGTHMQLLPHDKFVPALRLLTEGRSKPDVRALLEELNPLIVTYRARRLRLIRVLCQPFEDLLYMRRRRHRPGGRIRWPAARLAWRLVSNALDESTLIQLAESWTTTTGIDRKARNIVGRKLWRIGADVLATAVARAENDRDHFERLFRSDPEIRAEIADIAGILTIAPQIERLKVELPGKPIETLTERDMKVLLHRLGTVRRDAPSALPLLLLVLSMRMKRPNDLLAKLADAGVFARADQRRGGIVEVLERQVVEDLDQGSRDLRQTAIINGNVAGAMADAAVLVDRMDSLAIGLTVHRGGAVDAQLQKMRVAVRDFVVGDVLGTAEAEIGSVVGLPAGRPIAEVQPPTLDRMIVAENHARALRRALRIAPSLGLEGEVTGKIETLRERVIEDTVAMLARAERSDNMLEADAAEARLYTAVRMLELLIGPDEADALYRQGRLRLGLDEPEPVV